MKPVNSHFARYGTTIFEAMSALARERGAINLGQGFPEYGEPADIVAHAASALAEGSNQYPSMYGIPELRQAAADHDRDFYGLELAWDRQILVTSGATEALAATLFALIEPGDEAVLIEPLYDSYLPIVERAGGTARLARLQPPDWRLDRDQLAAAFGPRTKLILFNSPMNPTAKLFSDAELAWIAELATAHDAYVVADEVYEHLVFDGARHRPILTLPGMAERAIRIASAGKSFSLTGWKVGYVAASAALIQRIARAHQFLTFTTPPNLQSAVAFGLRKNLSYFKAQADALQARRDRLKAGLEGAGFAVGDAPGTYFLTADIGSIGYEGDDVAFCREIIEQAGVAAIPVSAFYAADPETRFVRFCFAKSEAMLDEAAARLQRLFGR